MPVFKDFLMLLNFRWICNLGYRHKLTLLNPQTQKKNNNISVFRQWMRVCFALIAPGDGAIKLQ